MPDRKRMSGIAAVLAAAILFAAPAFPQDEASHGWSRSGIGLLEGLPEIRAGYSDNGIALELKMRPGTGVVFSRDVPAAFDNVLLRMSTDPVRPGGNEYLPGNADFPVSVTLVYGRDRLKLGWTGRFLLFFKELRNGFRPSGIRLTYAWGTRLPVGSMYRLWEEETVFILAGPEEAGKTISSARRPADDFQAAYGRPPKGGVTKVLVRAEMPSGGKNGANTAITVRFPAD
ncbi:MAG: hypothetical protein AB1346_13610 [Thermodesulfobacteriota bacterium]